MAQLGKVTQPKLTAGILGHDVTWELGLNLARREPVDWAVVKVTDLPYNISTSLDELALRFLVELAVEFALEFFKLDHFSVLCCLDAFQSDELVLRLRSQLRLNVFNKRVQLLDSILFRFLHFFNSALYFADIVFEIS